MTLTPPSPSATEQAPALNAAAPDDPVPDDPVPDRRRYWLRFWWVMAAVTTVLAVTVSILAWWLSAQTQWSPVPIPTGVSPE